jgi:ssDNA-binding Zn-finger/Zn-ribbon topoisomerase 1
MSNLKDRLGRLERTSSERLKGVRCPNCREWPPARILETDIEGNQSWADPDVPESCPHCGWTPVVVEIVEVADWGSVGRPGR